MPHRIQKLLLLIIFTILCSCEKKIPCNVNGKKNTAEVKKLIAKADFFNKNESNSDSAFYYYNKAKLICDPKNDPEDYVRTLNSMAEIQLNFGDYIGSEHTLNNAIPYLKDIKKSKHVWDTYIILGTNYLNTYDFKNALLYYNKALNLHTENWRKQSAKKNIGTVLIEQAKYDEALQIFLPLAKNKKFIETPENYAATLDNIGFCFLKLKKSESFLYLNKALEIRTTIKNDPGIAISNLHLGNYFDENNNPVSAKEYGIKAYKKSNKIESLENKQLALKLIIKNSSDSDLKKYSMRFVDLVDSVIQLRQQAKNQFARIKYDSKREKEENLKLKTQKAENDLKLERQKNKNIISYIIIVLSLFLVIILYFYLTSKANKEKIEAAYNSETRISKKLHDELANDIYHTMAFAENKNLSLTENKEQLLYNLDAIYARTRDISKENCAIITDENYLSSLKEMISGFSTSSINIVLNGLDVISWDEINKNKKITVYRIIQELLVNMRKYSEASVVGINFKSEDKNLIVNYIDNGKGIDTDKMVFKNGLYNVKNRIHKIKGQVDISSEINQGFKVSIKFPL